MKSEVKITGNRVQITRIFDAPRAQVFGWWTQAEKLQQWSGCKGATKCEIQMDFRVGGSFHQKMQIAGAGEFSFTGTYEEIVAPERIAYSIKFGPALTRVAIDFTEESPDRTKVVLTHEGLPDEIFCKNIAQGTSESLEHLDSVLSGATIANRA